jgi:hypothetical protein
MSALVICGLLGIATPAAAQVQTAVEYGFRTVWDYGWSSFFVTAAPEEIAALDAGALDTDYGALWERTGLTFNVWTSPESLVVPTCRFFYPFWGFDHLYTPYAAECAAVQAHADWHYQYEGIVFYLKLPDENGECPAGTTVLYRLYLGVSAIPNPFPIHRLTTNPAIEDGFVLEGDARTFAFACVPSSTAQGTP